MFALRCEEIPQILAFLNRMFPTTNTGVNVEELGVRHAPTNRTTEQLFLGVHTEKFGIFEVLGL